MRPRHPIPAAAPAGLFRLPAHAGTARATGRDVLAAGDGWAAYGTGTAAGAAAGDAHVPTVTDRAGLVRAPAHVEAADPVKSRNGSAPHASGTLRGPSRTESGGGCPVGPLAIHNAYDFGSERDLTADAGRTPVPRGRTDSAAAADRAVARGAGAGRTA
ncbi:hypothetical protein [Streptomyces sp. SCL15-4]|uniref:hypothetical protein n=1 Tax=Streptomyces sp. SCL15-4 TaxID=2967221 RepID=UPI002966D7E4|nr:hypothetical protein [Streptomyces sp. SCL15-4]